MKNILRVFSFLFVLALLPITGVAWSDTSTQVGKTAVTVQANGSDTQWIFGHFRNEAIGLADYAATFNQTAYQDGLTIEKRCNALLESARSTIGRTSATFRGLNEVKCLSIEGVSAPGLEMIIYPQTTYDFRFSIRFIPQP